MDDRETPLAIERLLERLDEAGKAPLALIGFRLDENSSHLRGAAEAAPRIREALYSDAANQTTECGLDLGVGGPLLDVGDIGEAGEDGRTIEAAIAAILERGLRPISLGGDHSITSPIVRGFERTHDRLEVLQFDAHPDLYDEFEGNRLSHACPMARIMERGRVRRLVQIGVRTMNEPQQRQAERFGVEVIEMRRWDRDRPPVFEGPVYLTVDLDVLDPAFAPGVAHREPGGLSSRELIAAIQGLECDLVGADIVELNPRRDLDGITAPLASKLVKEIAARMLRSTR